MDKDNICPAKSYKTMVIEVGGYINLSFGEKRRKTHINKIHNELLGEGNDKPFYNYFLQQQE